MGKVYSAGCAFYAMFFMFSSSLEADTFKWVDDKGAVHYSDQSLNGKDKDADWVDDTPKTYFSFKPSKELKSAKAPVPPSVIATSKKARKPKINRPSYSQAPTGGASVSSPQVQQKSPLGGYLRQKSNAGKSRGRVSGGLNRAKGSAAGRY
jgi:hypothetical protein